MAASVDVRTRGQGPWIVVIPGTTRRAHHYDALATALAGDFTVHVIERRGRGQSPPQGPDYRLDQEVEDVCEVLDRTGSAMVFGHSYGGHIALELAVRRDLTRLIAYEPGVGLSLPQVRRDVARRLERGQPARAYATFLRELEFVPRRVPVALMWMMLRADREMREILPTVPVEMLAAETAGDVGRYAAITAPTLLLGGGRSPSYLHTALDRLSSLIPAAKVIMTPEFDHNAPDLGAPAEVARLIRA